MKKKTIIFLIIIIAAGAVGTVFFCRRNKYKDLCAYTEKVLKIEWNGCIESAAGDIETKIGEDELAKVKLEVRAGCEEEALNIVQNRFGKRFEMEISRTIIPGYQGHPFAAEIENSDIQYIFATCMEGKKVKTRSIRIYVVYNEKGQMYIYIMG